MVNKVTNRSALQEALQTIKRVGARRRSEIPAKILSALNRGDIETTNLVELLAIDFYKLLQNTFKKIPKGIASTLAHSQAIGITRRMAMAAQMMLEHYGPSVFEELKIHPADVIRGWACYLVGLIPKLSLSKRLKLIQPLADDPHSGVREWAWLSLRPYVANEVEVAIELLTPWVYEESHFLRRFATEITRPRGVWCTHIEILKNTPKLGSPLLNPLMSDSTKYVQDSVANWLNDAAKSQPAWVKAQCALWQKKSKTTATARICKRALRSFSRSEGTEIII